VWWRAIKSVQFFLLTMYKRCLYSMPCWYCYSTVVLILCFIWVKLMMIMMTMMMLTTTTRTSSAPSPNDDDHDDDHASIGILSIPRMSHSLAIIIIIEVALLNCIYASGLYNECGIYLLSRCSFCDFARTSCAAVAWCLLKVREMQRQSYIWAALGGGGRGQLSLCACPRLLHLSGWRCCPLVLLRTLLFVDSV